MFDSTEVANFVRVLLNRPRVASGDSAVWSAYARDGVPFRCAPASVGEPVDLLVVITTYQRPEGCLHLLRALRGTMDAAACDGFVLILHDHGDADYGPVREEADRLFNGKLLWLDATARLGKPRFWLAYQAAFEVARSLLPAHALFLQDDLSFERGMLEQVRALWRATASDPLRRVLYLFSSDADEKYGRWTLARRRNVGGGLRRTQWFDLQALYVDRAFFELLRYQMIPIHPNRWRRMPRLSSGVGKQLTLRLRGRANVYQAYPPLVFHGGSESQMNPAARAKRALDNRPLAEEPAVTTSPARSNDG
jgi:hypothetical protein